MNSSRPLTSLFVVLVAAAAAPAQAPIADEFKVKRQEVFEFTEKPQVVRSGDRVNITFAVKGLCDVTVAIEDVNGKIVRHLACGVLGDKAPPPFAKNSLRQKIVWDGKDDKGTYIDDKSRLRVRVALGLKPTYEKDLYSEPRKRSQQEACPMAAAKEGVYVFDGRVLDHLRLFDHAGNYVRTIYPFPANQVRNVKGLHWFKMPQDGLELPIKEGFHQSTLLSSGDNAGFDPSLNIGVDAHNNNHGSVWGNAVSAIAVHDSRIALARLRLNRLATDGSSGGLEMTGPETAFRLPLNKRDDVASVVPRSAAFSPDGKTLYLTGYVYARGQAATRDIVVVTGYEWLPLVAKLDFAAGAKMEVFVGSDKIASGGNGAKQFGTPTALAVDADGRVYVSDYSNNRIQVFSPAGELLKSIASPKPAQVSINPKTQEIYVFSWWIPTNAETKKVEEAPTKLTVLKSFADPRPIVSTSAPISPNAFRSPGYPLRAELDAFTDPPSIWFCAEWGRLDIQTRDRIRRTNISIHTLENGQLKKKRDFHDDVVRNVGHGDAAEYSRQRLYVDPATGLLYVGEGQTATGTAFKDLVRADPETGKCEVVTLPFDAEDMCFDADGLAYLRTYYLVARFNPRNWSEVPFDYGEEVNDVRTSSSREAKSASVQSALRLPVREAGLHHHGGMTVSIRGHLVVAVNNHGADVVTRKDVYDTPMESSGKPYTAPAFPGRTRWGEVHVWDKHGKMLYEDAFPGLNRLDGMGMDRDDGLYVMSTMTRVLNGHPYFNDMTGTMIKIQAKKGKVIGATDRAVVPLAKELRPERPPDASNPHVGQAWVEGAEWFYGGVGFCGKNGARVGGGCDCYNARPALDYLGRTFAPEIEHCSVAVLDSAGNLILRIGQYGNLDSAGPKSLAPLPGDGVGLIYAPYVATQTDKRLFIADPGNGRIVSVKLNYHSTETVAVK
jgi:DNA-binding beta-propeller fold protein YncE